VKKSFKAFEAEGVYTEIARDVIRASAEERRGNPRSSSAKLRWAKLSKPG
jgi:16S rRNA (cytosine1402-N4)-methyltransferase